MNPVKNQSVRYYFLFSAFMGFLAVAIGAFGAHALKGIINPERMPTFETGSKYHFYHTLVSFVVLIIAQQYGFNQRLKLSYIFFMAGIILFSFSLYVLAITEIKILGLITPFGGVSLLCGWLALAFGAYQSREVP